MSFSDNDFDEIKDEINNNNSNKIENVKETGGIIENNDKENEKDMIVYFTTDYEVSTNDLGQTVVNKVFTLYEFLGQGSFWKASKVKRNVETDKFVDKNFYIFKEGMLNFKDEEQVFNLMQMSYEEKNKLTEEESEVRLGLREYNILKILNDKNIARLYQVIVSLKNNLIIFVMEYCDLGVLMSLKDEEEDVCFEYNNKLLLNLFQMDVDIGLNWKEEFLKIFKIDNNFDEHSSNSQEFIEFMKDNIKALNLSFKTHTKILIKTAIFLFKQLASAILYLHNKLIAHRDIKVDNIVLKVNDETKSVDLKLIDFSISVKMKNIYDRIELTKCTEIFCPPEMKEFIPYDPFKVDIYQFGTTLYCYLFNWKKDCDFSLEDINNKDNWEILHKENQDLYDILVNCLSPNPDSRMNAFELLERFNNL